LSKKKGNSSDVSEFIVLQYTFNTEEHIYTVNTFKFVATNFHGLRKKLYFVDT